MSEKKPKSHLAKLTEDEIERSCVEMVFCLGGGELAERNPKFPDIWDGIDYWYKGAPDYVEYANDFSRDCLLCSGGNPKNATEDCKLCENTGELPVEYRTSIECVLYVQPEDSRVFVDLTPSKPVYEFWVQKDLFRSSGETPCWFCHKDCQENGSERQEDVYARLKKEHGIDACPYCESDWNDPICWSSISYVYLGEGWAEIVWMKIHKEEYHLAWSNYLARSPIDEQMSTWNKFWRSNAR